MKQVAEMIAIKVKKILQKVSRVADDSSSFHLLHTLPSNFQLVDRFNKLSNRANQSEGSSDELLSHT